MGWGEGGRGSEGKEEGEKCKHDAIEYKRAWKTASLTHSLMNNQIGRLDLWENKLTRGVRNREETGGHRGPWIRRPRLV